MYYLFVSIFLVIVLCFIEYRRVKFLGKEKSVLDSLKKDWNFVYIFFFSLMFVSLISLAVLFLEDVGFVKIVEKDFSFRVFPHIIYSILVVPLVEEYFFRFLPFDFISEKRMIYIIGIIISSLLFSFFHKTDFNYMIFIFVIGMLFSLLFLKTKNLSYCIFCHSLYNIFMNYLIYVGSVDVKLILVIFGISLLVMVYKAKNRVILR